jgi:hypothetical protein
MGISMPGKIDISKYIENKTPIPAGINIKEDVFQELLDTCLQNEEYTKNTRWLFQNYKDILFNLIDTRNNGQINVNDYINTNLIEEPRLYAKHFQGKGYDLKKYFKEVKNVKDILSPIKDKDELQGIIGGLATEGLFVRQKFRTTQISQELYEFKDSCISEIIYEDQDEYLNTLKDQEGYSWENMLEDIEQFEYYTTDTGRFLVDSRNGALLGICDNGEIINIEDNTELQSTEKNERSSNAIKYTFDDKETQIFITEKDENGKYKLKGFVQDENGKYTSMDVGVGRDFCDDSTELDRQIITQTSEVRSGTIKEVTDKIKTEMNKEIYTEKENVEEEKEENDGR